MTINYETPQDAEDAYYDALEEGNLESLLAVWDSTDDISCLLPMQPLVTGPGGIKKTFSELLQQAGKLELSVKHLQWIEGSDIAIHLVEERIAGSAPGGQQPPPLYGTNIYRKTRDGWRLAVHQNGPMPPPPGMMPPMGGRPG